MKIGPLTIAFFNAPHTVRSPGHELGFLFRLGPHYLALSANLGRISSTWATSTRCCVGAGLKKLAQGDQS